MKPGRFDHDACIEPGLATAKAAAKIELAVVLVIELVATNAIVLAPTADLRELAENLAGALTELAGADPVT